MSTLRFTDTLSGRKVDFEPRDAGRVGVYWCGPTVYDHPHLGHGRSALAFDVLVRYLRWRGFEVTLTRNVTDIDDKIIARAAAEGSTEAEVAATYEASYLAEMDRLGIVRPDHAPHATGFVPEMVAVVQRLVDSGRAYVIEGSGVYFDVSSLDDYGALVHRHPDELREAAGARVDIDTTKTDPLDFALWKAAKPGEPTWDSPWGPGRPGWHIECVAMALDLLGEGFDIHGGGDDLTFPHHENERAEAVGAGYRFARYWLHNGMVNVEGEKMSKSLGNFTTLADVLDAHDPRALRLLVLQTHYRKTMEITGDSLAQAGAAVERLDALARRATAAGVDWSDAATDPELVESFARAMDDDLATPSALAVVFEAVRQANGAVDEDPARAAVLVSTVIDLAGALGLEVATSRDVGTDDAEIDELVQARTDARAARDFATADRLRDELAARGIVLEDGPGGTTWHRSG